jgi:hypothetical protein
MKTCGSEAKQSDAERKHKTGTGRVGKRKTKDFASQWSANGYEQSPAFMLVELSHEACQLEVQANTNLVNVLCPSLLQREKFMSKVHLCLVHCFTY